MQIEVTDRPSTDVFKGTIQITVRRPVFGTSYNSPLMNFKDDDFNFNYVEFQTLEFNESGTNPNLISMLAYYAYTILGFDYDSYALMGGGQYFAKAQAIVANNANAVESGWRAFESTRNRYWLSENINNPIYKPIRILFYDYHRKGLDSMTKTKDESVRTITSAMLKLRKVYDDKPGSLFMKMVFDAKNEEIVNIFSQAPNDLKADIMLLLNDLDPTNASKYQKIQTGGN